MILIATGYLLSSCSMERQLALQFVETESKSTPVMLVPPPLLHMYNNKPVHFYSNQSSLDIDSLAFYQSDFLQYISDSIFLENYMNSFIEDSRKFGFKVFLPNELEEFINIKELAYIMRIPQMELVEDTISWEIEEQVNFMKSSRIIPINSIGLSTWFEISEKDSASYHIYFDEQIITDETYGDFRQELWSLDIKYDYTVFKLEQEDIYQFASDLGSLHASYFFDLILNTYIWNHIPEDKKGHYIYLHYNHDYHSVEAADAAFIRLDDE